MFGNLDQTRMKEDQQRLIALTAAGELTASNRGLEASLCVPWPAVPRDSIGRKAADTRRGEIDRRWAETKQGSRLRLPTGRNAPIGSRQKSLHGHLNRHAARRDKRGKKKMIKTKRKHGKERKKKQQGISMHLWEGNSNGKKFLAATKSFLIYVNLSNVVN